MRVLASHKILRDFVGEVDLLEVGFKVHWGLLVN